MDATTASGFILAHFSHYYSTRTVVRGFVMGRLMPSVEQLLHDRLPNGHEPDLSDDLLATLSSARLKELDELCRQHGSRFIMVVPPTYQKGADTIARSGREQHVTVLVPVENDEFNASHFQPDGFHLSPKGAQIFTARLAASLSHELRK